MFDCPAVAAEALGGFDAFARDPGDDAAGPQAARQSSWSKPLPSWSLSGRHLGLL